MAVEDSLVDDSFDEDCLVGAESDLEPDSVDDFDSVEPSLEPAPLGLADGRESRASFFAQPLPLKWMDGVEMSLRIGPPHSSHAVGPRSFTPCNFSTTWPQVRHS